MLKTLETGMYLDFEELLEADYLCLRSIVHRLLLRLKDKAGWKSVSVLALCTIRTFPKPPEPTRLFSTFIEQTGGEYVCIKQHTSGTQWLR